MKKTLLFFITLILILSLSFTAPAHPGKTDGNGGHYDNNAGEYHYHHGYPAHQHTNGKCPYDFEDKTNHNAGSTTNKTTSSTYSDSYYNEKISGLEDEIASLESTLSKAQKKSSDRFDVIIGLCILIIIAVISLFSSKKMANSLKQDSMNYNHLLKEYKKQNNELEQLKKEKQYEEDVFKYADTIRWKYRGKGYDVNLFSTEDPNEKYLVAYNEHSKLLIQCIYFSNQEICNKKYVLRLINTLSLFDKEKIKPVLICNTSLSDEAYEMINKYGIEFRENHK